VRVRLPQPSAEMTLIWPSASSNAIQRPSADQFGEPTCAPADEVNWTAFFPSASQTQISREPERSEANVIRLPSGE